MKNRISLHTYTQASVSSNKRDHGREIVHLVLESFPQLSCCGVNLKTRREDADLFLEGLTPQTAIVGEQTSGPFLCMKAAPGSDVPEGHCRVPTEEPWWWPPFSDQERHCRDPFIRLGVWGVGYKTLLEICLEVISTFRAACFQPSSDLYLEVGTLAGLWLAPSAAAIPMHPGKKTQSSSAACLSFLRSGKPEESAKHCLMVLTLLLKKLTCVCHIKSACEFSLGLSFLEYSQRAHCLPPYYPGLEWVSPWPLDRT